MESLNNLHVNLSIPRIFLVLGALGLFLTGCSDTDTKTEVSEQSTVTEPAKTVVATPKNQDYVFTIRSATWQAEKERMKVKVRGKQGDEITLTNAARKLQVLASVELEEDGSHEFKLKKMADVPCRIRADRKSDGMSIELDVEGKPDNCI